MHESKNWTCVEMKSKKTWYKINPNDCRIQFNKVILALKQVLIQLGKDLNGIPTKIPYLVIRAEGVALSIKGSCLAFVQQSYKMEMKILRLYSHQGLSLDLITFQDLFTR